MGYKSLLFAGVIVTGVAYTLQIFGYKAVKPIFATLILSSEAIFAVIGGIVILHETMTLKELSGCLIMSLAIVISKINFKNIFKRNIFKEITYERMNLKQNI